jgi:hypothetical protein
MNLFDTVLMVGAPMAIVVRMALFLRPAKRERKTA